MIPSKHKIFFKIFIQHLYRYYKNSKEYVLHKMKLLFSKIKILFRYLKMGLKVESLLGVNLFVKMVSLLFIYIRGIEY